MAHLIRPRLWASALVGACLFGCAQAAPEVQKPRHVPRPVAGDRVTPDVLVVGDWKAGRAAFLNLRCRAQGPRDAEPTFLLARDVPEECLPQVSVTFLEGEREFQRVEALPTERSC